MIVASRNTSLKWFTPYNNDDIAEKSKITALRQHLPAEALYINQPTKYSASKSICFLPVIPNFAFGGLTNPPQNCGLFDFV